MRPTNLIKLCSILILAFFTLLHTNSFSYNDVHKKKSSLESSPAFKRMLEMLREKEITKNKKEKGENSQNNRNSNHDYSNSEENKNTDTKTTNTNTEEDKAVISKLFDEEATQEHFEEQEEADIPELNVLGT